MSRHCPSCGSTVQDDAAVCPTCGETLEGAAPAGSHENVAATAEAPATSPRRTPSSSMRDYLLTTVAAVVIGGGALLISTPEEKAGPPLTPEQQQAAAAGSMPNGHPPVNNKPQITPEQQQQIADAEKMASANPADLDAKLKLANLYYDVDRHAEAVPLYREYVKVHPENLGVRTDMAFSIASTAGLDSGITELHQVLEKDPKFQNAVYNLAMMYIAKRNRDSTLYWLRRTVEIDPSSRPGQFAAQVLQGVQSGALSDSTGAAAR